MRGERRRLRPHLGKLPGEAFAGALWANQNGKNPMPPPLFFERVRKGLKAKSLEWQMLCTENGRVRKSMNGKDLDQNRGNAHILRELGLEADRLRLGASRKPCTNRSLGSLRSLPARAGAGGIRMDSTSLTTGPCRIVNCQRAEAPG